MKVMTNLDMETNQLSNVVIHKVNSDPVATSKIEGMIIYNIKDKKLKFCNGSQWISIASIVIDTKLSDSSSNNHVAGSKAVVDYVKNYTSNLQATIREINMIDNNSVLRTSDDGSIIGIKVDSDAKKDSNNLINSNAVFKEIEGVRTTSLTNSDIDTIFSNK